jgi:cytochrome c5
MTPAAAILAACASAPAAPDRVVPQAAQQLNERIAQARVAKGIDDYGKEAAAECFGGNVSRTIDW